MSGAARVVLGYGDEATAGRRLDGSATDSPLIIVWDFLVPALLWYGMLVLKGVVHRRSLRQVDGALRS